MYTSNPGLLCLGGCQCLINESSDLHLKIFYGGCVCKKPFLKALWTEARHLWKTSDLRIHSQKRCICCISTVSFLPFLDLCPALSQGNQCHLQDYGTSSSVNGSEANRMVPAFPYSSFCDSKIFAQCVWQPPTSEVAQKGCSFRKGDALKQTSCSRPRHAEGHRQWELQTAGL